MLSKEVIDYIQQHAHVDVPSFLLRKDHPSHLPIRFIAQQIESRRKAKVKLPHWVSRKDLLFPAPLSVEQSSSEVTARFKAGLLTGKRALDLTGGFGVDTAAFAHSFTHVDYVEQNDELKNIAQYNFQKMGLQHIHCHSNSAAHFLKDSAHSYDLIFIDPDRRPDKTKRVIGLADSTPDVVALYPLLIEKAEHVMIKASPMLDIHSVEKQLPQLKSVYVVAVQGECKETLFLFSKKHSSASPEMIACNLKEGKEPNLFADQLKDHTLTVSISAPQKYIYEPSAAILKAQLSHSLAKSFNLSKLHPFTFLFTSPSFHKGYPGRVFECFHQIPFKTKLLQKYLPERKANITTRNFPLNVSAIRKKTGIKEGGDFYLFACTLQDNSKSILICRKA